MFSALIKGTNKQTTTTKTQRQQQGQKQAALDEAEFAAALPQQLSLPPTCLWGTSKEPWGLKPKTALTSACPNCRCLQIAHLVKLHSVPVICREAQDPAFLAASWVTDDVTVLWTTAMATATVEDSLYSTSFCQWSTLYLIIPIFPCLLHLGDST